MKIKNGFKFKKNGWNYISIRGNASERGYAHGVLLRDEIKECLKTLKWKMYDTHGIEMAFFVEVSNFLFKKPLEENFPEFFE